MPASPPATAALEPWQEPELTGIRRLPGRSGTLPYATWDDAWHGRHAQVLDLAGPWHLRVVEGPHAVPSDFPLVDAAAWPVVAVPGQWTMQGHGVPLYPNSRMGFAPAIPPRVPDVNPTGLYRMAFDVPAAWAERRLVLHFAGVETCFAAWVNGVPVGFGKDSRMASEFDITGVAHAGVNQLAVQVMRWGDGAYLEDQDHWRQAGIHRAVRLIATARTWLRDVSVQGGYDAATDTGSLTVEAWADGALASGWTVRMAVFAPDGVRLPEADLAAEVPWQLLHRLTDRVEGLARLAAAIPAVRPWSAEVPDLHLAVVALHAPDGALVEATRVRFGFRRVEAGDGGLRVNGRRVMIQGANRHEHHDVTGGAVDAATALSDVRALKEFGFNAVRCAHYPPDPAFLDLCDEHGLYVLDEADIETHHYYNTPANDPRWTAAFLDRGMRMVLRDRNHPCVIGWSLGNESGYGANHDALAAWIRRSDPGRFLHYEGAICTAVSGWERGHAATDVVCPMYAPVAALVRHALTGGDRRPVILSEYAHAMGNSCGGLVDYWRAFRSHERLQGGFIWELLDHGIRCATPDGGVGWGYGGDFGDAPDDANYCIDGLLWPDRRPHPAMWECRRLFQPLVLMPGADGAVCTVESRFETLRTTHLEARWHLLVDGRPCADGILALPDLGPGGSGEACLALPALSPAPGQEVHVLVTVHDQRSSGLLPAGHEVAWEQWPLPAAPAAPSPVLPERPDATLAAGTDGPAWGLPGPGLAEVRILPTVWRAPTDNDGIKAWAWGRERRPRDSALTRWLACGLDRCRMVVDACEEGPGRLLLRRRLLAGDGGTVLAEDCRIESEGGVLRCMHDFTVGAGYDDLPRLGVEMQLPTSFDDLEWFGRGPLDSYRDRQEGMRLGRFRCPLTERYVPYIVPQEHGNITGLRWLALRRADGAGLLASLDRPGEGKASLHGDAELARALHTWELPAPHAVHLHLDAAQRGLGSASCGPDTDPRFRIAAGSRWRLAYRLMALEHADDAGVLHRAVAG